MAENVRNEDEEDEVVCLTCGVIACKKECDNGCIKHVEAFSARAVARLGLSGMKIRYNGLFLFCIIIILGTFD